MSSLINKLFTHVQPPANAASSGEAESRGRNTKAEPGSLLSGRGGMGNRSQSRGRALPTAITADESTTDIASARAASGSRERSSSRGGLASGREYGRGGAGNRMRSVSRDPAGALERLAAGTTTELQEEQFRHESAIVERMEREDELVEEEYKLKEHSHGTTSGRGGYGNVH